MTLDGTLAFLAAAAAVPAANEALAAVDSSGLLSSAAGLLAPVARARSAGAEPSTGESRRLAVVAAATLVAAGWFAFGPLPGLALGAAGPWVALATVRAGRARHRAGLVAGAPAIARALADALAGGHSVHGAVLEAARGGGVRGTAGAELTRVSQALAFGAPVDDALEALRTRARSTEYDTIVAAIALQRRAGGDLAGLLREIADGIDEAGRLEADARGATAQARFTGLMVAGLPLGAAALAELASPGYLARLAARPLTALLAAFAALLQLVALLAIRRLSRVRA